MDEGLFYFFFIKFLFYFIFISPQAGNAERTSYVCKYMYIHTYAVLYTNYLYARFVSQILSCCCVTWLCDNAGLLLSLAGCPCTLFSFICRRFVCITFLCFVVEGAFQSQHFGSLVLWFFGSLILWFFGSLVLGSWPVSRDLI